MVKLSKSPAKTKAGRTTSQQLLVIIWAQRLSRSDPQYSEISAANSTYGSECAGGRGELDRRSGKLPSSGITKPSEETSLLKVCITADLLKHDGGLAVVSEFCCWQRSSSPRTPAVEVRTWPESMGNRRCSAQQQYSSHRRRMRSLQLPILILTARDALL
jgi:hypothetical protein